MPRVARSLAIVAIAVLAIACETVRDPQPPQAALNFDITNTALSSQRAPLPAPQVVSWRVDEMTASGIEGFEGTYSFLFSGPCAYLLNALFPVSFTGACRTSGLTLTPGTVVEDAVFRLTISRLEVRTAARPDLSFTGDPDGDGIPNISDNCPIVPNFNQLNTNLTTENVAVGDACSLTDASGQPTIPDQDLDGIGDALDNCTWYPNPLGAGETAPPDANLDGIGDACERVAPVVLPGGSLTIECDGVGFTTVASTISFFRLDFGRPGVLTCDAGFTGCSIDPSALELSQAGTAVTFACHEAP